MSIISIYNIGINIGSVSVNVVAVNEKGEIQSFKTPHLGKPEAVLNDIMQKNFQDADCYFGVSGSFGEISEITAIERGINSFREKYDAIISVGGEAIVLYALDKEGHIANVLSQDKCAAGSGEFFKQQIDRLGVSLDDAIQQALKGNRIELASRCSVHCKSDITHKLNRGEASIPDLLASVLASMANKVKGLVIQSKSKINRVLIIGGVSLNEAFIRILREELEGIKIVLKDVSSVFEAYGTALLVKDSPTEKKIDLKTSMSFSTLPALRNFAEKVTIIEAKDYKKDFERNQTFILGVDVGSTTTKSVLLDPSDLSILASYYGRTNGNPIEAARKCIQEMITQVGDLPIHLAGVTGSGRQIVAAYFGTEAVYNEISAHSIGAVYYDPEVDTIFEIGGQDSKYMYLQNGVPVDYAMNASCSAGTGSFLEESSKGDLGIDVYSISNTAMEADGPVRFQADCAAFINTDIRTALQEGYGRENVIGGLVYSIVDNYLNKVKGSRPVGRKVFFQGGVAKNSSVGYAFAEATDKEIIIPPNPELVGAFGIALLSKNKYETHEIHGFQNKTTMSSLIQQELKHLGSVICRSCKNYCQIERYEVGGRKFLFGGSCTKYEHQWKGTEKIEEKEDLVAIRNDLIFNNNDKKPVKFLKSKGRIGIPRAMLTHSLYPLFSTFFDELNYDVILSDQDEDRDLVTNAPFCFPVKLLHGAILDLTKKNVTAIFLPHLLNMPRGEDWFESTFCPITQASPYYMEVNFRKTRFLKPILDFLEGYSKDKALVEMAVNELKIPRKIAKMAFEKAVKKQEEVEQKFLEYGKKAIKEIEDNNEIGILLLGRSYNAFPPETSLQIPKKLSSMGYPVIPFDFLEKTSSKDLPWYFGNYVKMAIDLALKKENLFILYINSFSCTTDAFIQNYVRTEMSHKPYLFLELDSHTADAGIQTRLEAFIEIIKNYRASKISKEEKPFQITKVKKRNGKIVVITSEGKTLGIKDPRVKLHLPPFSKYHTDLGIKMLDVFGYNTGESTDIVLDFPVKGYRCSTGKECIPLPVVLGHILSVVENRKPGEVVGFYMIRGGHPCVVFSYYHYIEQFIEQNKLENVFIYRYDYLTGFLGMSLLEVLQFAPPLVFIGDMLLEIESALHVVGEKNSLDLLHRYWEDFLESINNKSAFRKNVKTLIKNISKIPRKDNPVDLPKVLVSGDFFVRFSSFFLRELRDIYSKNGIIVKSTDLLELLLYSQHFQGGYYITKIWKKDPDKFSSFLRSVFTPWDKASRMLLLSKVIIKTVHLLEKHYRRRFDITELLYAEPNDLKEIFKNSRPLISPLIFGEAIPTIGKGMETLHKSMYDTLILTGPFNCLPYKVSQAILKPIYYENNMPFLVFDVDISAITPNMKRLIQANIEQIKRRRETSKKETRLSDILEKKKINWSRKRARMEYRWQKKVARKQKRLTRRSARKERQWNRIEYQKTKQWRKIETKIEEE
ncbi:MAG: acyl-CoA dehydratase activase [Candidatus Thorarchaeota archaeon]